MVFVISNDGPSFYEPMERRTPPDPTWLSLTERPGWLRLRGRESPQSLHRQSLVARNRQHFRVRFETCVDFEPRSFQQLAGLICMYDDQNFHYLAISHDEQQGKCIQVLSNQLDVYSEALATPVPLPAGRLVYLRAEFDAADLRFFISSDGSNFTQLGPVLDASTLSDEHTTMGIGFTGTFVGLCVHDMTGGGIVADFDYMDECVLD